MRRDAQDRTRATHDERRTTPLDRQLAETFLRARWPQTDGAPVCPLCYHGESVREDPKAARKRRPELPTYYCGACVTRFTATSKTVLSGSPQPLRAWAIALLTLKGAPATQQDKRYRLVETGYAHRILDGLRARWAQGTELGPRWLKELRATGIHFSTFAFTKEIDGGSDERDRPRATAAGRH